VIRVGQPRREIQFVPHRIAGMPVADRGVRANYPKVSQAIWTAIQASITGTSSVSSALQTAQGTISGVQQVSGG
jgi:hypothetical protein